MVRKLKMKQLLECGKDHELTETEAAITGPAAGLLHIYYNFQFRSFMGLLNG